MCTRAFLTSYRREATIRTSFRTPPPTPAHLPSLAEAKGAADGLRLNR